jgi:hypothetical protein
LLHIFIKFLSIDKEEEEIKYIIKDIKNIIKMRDKKYIIICFFLFLNQFKILYHIFYILVKRLDYVGLHFLHSILVYYLTVTYG